MVNVVYTVKYHSIVWLHQDDSDYIIVIDTSDENFPSQRSLPFCNFADPYPKDTFMKDFFTKYGLHLHGCPIPVGDNEFSQYFMLEISAGFFEVNRQLKGKAELCELSRFLESGVASDFERTIFLQAAAMKMRCDPEFCDRQWPFLAEHAAKVLESTQSIEYTFQQTPLSQEG